MLAESVFRVSVANTLDAKPFEDLVLIELAWAVVATEVRMVAISCAVRDIVQV